MKVGTTKASITVALGLVLLLLPVFQSAYADSQPLSLTVTGSTLDAGNQNYSVAGGQVVFASIAGLTIDPSSAQLTFSLQAQVHDLGVSGNAKFSLQGTSVDGTPVSATGNVQVSTMVPGAGLPLGCTTNCNSAVPFFFVGASNGQVSIAGAAQRISTTMQVENPYFNPFGAPIILASTDNSIVIVTTYTQGTIQWKGVTLGGILAGTLGTNPVSGNFNMTSNESEDLVAGTAVDHGAIAFTSMNPSSLNSKGRYDGSSVIPLAGATDCSALTGIPGTCTETGFQSTGTFSMNGKVSMSGTYSTQWTVPALGFGAVVSATVA